MPSKTQLSEQLTLEKFEEMVVQGLVGIAKWQSYYALSITQAECPDPAAFRLAAQYCAKAVDLLNATLTELQAVKANPPTHGHSNEKH